MISTTFDRFWVRDRTTVRPLQGCADLDCRACSDQETEVSVADVVDISYVGRVRSL